MGKKQLPLSGRILFAGASENDGFEVVYHSSLLNCALKLLSPYSTRREEKNHASFL
jgi:hypothetical protein